MKKSYHKQGKFCHSRPSYREARWERAVKVYTINQESRFLLVQGTPSVGVSKEMVELFALYGTIDEYRILDEYPSEEFTDTYWIKFRKIQSARYAKKKLDMRSFFGGILHVAYAPEYETVNDTRQKLQERRQQVARKCREYFPKQDVSTTQDAESSGSKLSAVKEPIAESEPEHTSISNLEANANQPSSETQTLFLPPPNSSNISAAQSAFPLLPLPPRHLPFYCYPPPPPPPDYPRIPTKHATLPSSLQTISRADMKRNPAAAARAGNAASSVESDKNMERSSQVSSTLVGTGLKKPLSDSVKMPNSISEKRIVWMKQPSASSASSSLQTSTPGAWDPFAEKRKLKKSLTGDQNLDNVAQTIREKLKNVAEIAAPASTTTEGEPSSESTNTCPIQQKKPRKRI